MLDAIKRKYNEYQDARIRERVAEMNAEGAAARDAKAKAEADRLAAVSASVRAGSAERMAPPPQAGMVRRPAMTATLNGAPGAPVVSGRARKRLVDNQIDETTGMPRR